MIANQLPTLGYLTLLDIYILGVFGIIVVVIVELTLLEWLDVEQEYQRYTLYGDVGVWALSNAGFATYVYRAIGHTERLKTRELQSTTSNSQLKKSSISNIATKVNSTFAEHRL